MACREPPPAATVPSVLQPELLGFVPQFLLDDIIDTANDAVRQAVEAMEVFLRRWASQREARVDQDWDSTQEVEQGLVAFQTLLNSHVDIAFDFFELWSLRNIFAVPADLPIVAPHQADLNLEHTAEEETELVNEIRELRRKIQAQRKLQRLFSLAVRKSAVQRAYSEKRLERLAFLRSPLLQTLVGLPEDFLTTHDAVASLPPYDPNIASQLSMPLAEPGKRPWETNKTGYINWAVTQAVARVKEKDREKETTEVSDNIAVRSVVSATSKVAKVDDIKAVLQLMGAAAALSSSRKGTMNST